MPKSSSNKGKASEREEKLALKRESAWIGLKPREMKAVMDFAEEYKRFMDNAKTERLAVKEIVRLAEKNGFKPFEKTKKYKPGERVYFVNKNKNVILAVLGKEDIVKGANIIASHVDAPRLDLKQNPLYEDSDSELALFKTHYYGGIKKYQWVNIPLALYGQMVRSDGKHLDISIGDDPDDPIFTVPDLLPHLSRKAQGERTLGEGIKGEELNIVIGNIPVDNNDSKEKLKLKVLELLYEKYGITEEDFVSAELEAVPAWKARDVGLDRSMIGAYGQDDRICAYISMVSIFDMKVPKRTSIALILDKEEVGSDGSTGAKSHFFVICMEDIIRLRHPDATGYHLKKALSSSKMLSADVSTAVNPTFKKVHELNNAGKLGHGLGLKKYTGAGGKFSASDANAEFVGEIRLLLNKNNIPWQATEMGKVDEGGGGTVAKFLAVYNMEVLDCGPPLMSMHSPFEVTSKVDLYNAYRAFGAFYGS